MRVKIYGSRGSVPAPYLPAYMESRIAGLMERFLREGHTDPHEVVPWLSKLPTSQKGGYGGNTLCVSVTSNTGKVIIIDGGSGIRHLGQELMKGECGKGRGEVHIFFTHFHWDHTCGLPFFIPIYIPGNRIHLYSVQPELEEMMDTMFRRPFFPVARKDIPSTIIYHRLEPRVESVAGEFAVAPYRLDHPDPCWGFRVRCDGKVFSHCSDSEAVRVTREDLGDDIALYQNVDVALFDAQFTLIEALEKAGWGHASASILLELAMREGVKRAFFLHHDPWATDEKIREGEEYAREYYIEQLGQGRAAGLKLNAVSWGYAFEGMEIEI